MPLPLHTVLQWFTRTFLAAAVWIGFALLSTETLAAININSATLNGAASVTVVSGATISANVNVTTSGSGSANNWYSTGWRISTTAPGTVTCDNTPNFGSSGTNNQTFNITAPASAGTYNVYFIAYNSDDCSSGASATYTMASAVIVVVPPTVTSINRASADPTAPATSVSWTVTFSASVTGVDASDFALAASGVTGASITSVTGSGTTWTVTANTGSGGGTLGLNLVDNDSIVSGTTPLGGSGAGNGNFTGQVYTVVVPFACTQPANTPAGLNLTCVCDTFGRATLNPSTIFGANWIASTSDTTGILPSIVNPGYLRLTNNTGNNAKAATVPGIFPAAGNYISVEFRQYAYNGSGADGIAVTLSDYSVPAVPGAFGGSLGYAQRTGVNGFAGGWIGVAMDEYGNYQNPTEGRIGGPGFIRDSVGARGSGSGSSGYNWLGGTATLAPQIDNAGSATPSLGYFYQVIIDARNEPTSTAVAVNRDTGGGYASLITIPNVYVAAAAQGFTQVPVPTNWQISFTGSTGGSTNIHEIGSLRICASTIWPPSGGTASGFNAIDEAYGNASVAPRVPVQNYLNGHIYMKVAGTPFKLNVAALANNQIQTAYVVTGSKAVTVKLVDNSDGACVLDSTQPGYCSATCTGKAAVTGGSQTLTFVPADLGQKQSTDFTLNSAYKNLAAIISDGTVTACSTDAFSVRPLSVTSVTSSNATNAGTTGTPIFKAGSDNFSLTATIPGVTGAPAGTLNGYTGVLKINNATLQVIAPATVAGMVAGTFPAATSASPSSTATGNFTYSEVGAFRLPGYNPATDLTSRRGVFDGVDTLNECTTPPAPAIPLTPTQCDALRAATWTGVDSISTKGDCILDSYRNTRDTSGTFATNVNYGKFGCNFGLTSNTAGFGRFIPDHFSMSGGAIRNRADLATTGSIAAGSTSLTLASVDNVQVGGLLTVEGAGPLPGGGLTSTIVAVNRVTRVATLTTAALNAVAGANVYPEGFTYMGEPIRANFTLTAQNATNDTTRNYEGTLAKLDLSVPAKFNLGALDRYSASPVRNIVQITQANPGVVTTSGSHGYATGDAVYINGVQGMAEVNNRSYTVAVTDATHFSLGVNTSGFSAYTSGGFALKAASGTDLSARLALTSSSGSWTSGVATNIPLVFSFTRALDGPFVPEFGIAPVDTDGVLLAPYDMDISAPAGNDHASLGLTSVRLGRLKFSNAYGSELLDLSLPMETQYWNGASYARNTLDYGTSLANSGAGITNFGLSNYRRSLASGETSLQPAATVTFSAGFASMRLTRPGAGNSGNVRVCADLDAVAGTGDTTCQAAGAVANMPYLQGGAGFNIDPSADITFGTHKSGPVIYLREGY